MAPSSDCRAGQSCHINDVGGFLFPNGKGHCICQRNAAFCIGVVDFNGFARHGINDIARVIGVSREDVFTGGYYCSDVDPVSYTHLDVYKRQA